MVDENDAYKLLYFGIKKDIELMIKLINDKLKLKEK